MLSVANTKGRMSGTEAFMRIPSLSSLSSLVIAAGLLVSTQFATPAHAEPFTADKAHSRISFMAYTKLFDTLGIFDSWKIKKADLNWDDMTKSSLELVVDVKSLNTDNKRRDDHLRNEDFLHVTKFPKATFKSTKFEVVDAEHLKVTGNLTIKGKTQQVVVPVEVVKFEKPLKNGKKRKVMRLKGKITIKRKSFGVTYEAGALMPSIKDDVDIKIDLNMVGPK